MNYLDLGNGFKTIKREIINSVSGIIYKENNDFIFEISFSQDLTYILLQGSPFKIISQNPNLYQANNMKFMLKKI